MHPHFASVVESLDPTFRLLMQQSAVRYAALPKGMPASGIYLFSEGDRHLYVGRSRGIRKRLRRHCSLGSTYKMGAFAFLLAREATGRIKATYKKAGSRKALMLDRDFTAAFDRAKARIREMDIRFVAEPDPVRQAVLEIYTSVALRTPYNDFDTH